MDIQCCKETKLQSAMISFRGTEIGCHGRWGTCIDSTLTGKRPCQRQRDSVGRREKNRLPMILKKSGVYVEKK